MNKEKSLLGIVVAVSTLCLMAFLARDFATAAKAVGLPPQTMQQRILEGKPLKPNSTHRPPKGYVPDETTAVRIAEAVLSPIYGEEQIKNERPFKGRLVEGVWIVSGTLKD